MTLRVGLPDDAKGLKILGEDGIWTPAIGTQQVENLVTNPGFEAVQAGSTVLRINYARDPDAQYSPNNFSNIGGTPAGGTREIATDNPHHGTTSWKISVTTAGQVGNEALVPTNSLITRKGDIFVWSFWIYSTIAGTIVPYWEGAKVTDGSYIGGSGGASVSIPANQWTKVTGKYTAVVDAYVGGAGGYNLTANIGDTVWMDEFLIEKSDTLGEFFFGDTTDSLGWDYGWTGTAGSSTSTAKATSVEVRRNLSRNPGFEIDTSGYGSANEATVTRVESTAMSGVAHGRITFTASTISDSGMNFAPTGTWEASTQYTASMDLISSTTRTVKFSAQGTGTVNQTSANYSLTAGVKTRLSWTFSTSATAPTEVALYILRTEPSLGTIDVDQFMIEKTSIVRPFFDGSTSSTGDFSYSWVGSVDASASIQVAPKPALLVAPLFDYGVAVQSSEWSSSGKSSVRIIPTRFSDSFTQLPDPGFVKGKTYTLLAKVRLASAQTGSLDGRARKAVIRYNNITVTDSVAAVPNLAGTHTYRVTFTIPLSGVLSQFRLYNGASVGNGDVWWDDILLVEGTYTGDYFDGDTPADIDYIYRWSGTPHASTSIGN